MKLINAYQRAIIHLWPKQRGSEEGYHWKISFLIYDDTKREADAVPVTPFHVNKQVDTVLWWRRWWWWWYFLSSITPVGGYRVGRMGMGFGVSWKATVIHRSNSVEAIPFPQTGTNRLEQTLAASFLPGNFYKWGDTHSKRGQKGEGVCEWVCVCVCVCVHMHAYKPTSKRRDYLSTLTLAIYYKALLKKKKKSKIGIFHFNLLSPELLS